MTLEELFKKRLIIVSGKGGVGKTTVSVLMALLGAGQKKKVLLAEMNSSERVAPFFGQKKMGYVETELSPFLSGININPRSAFQEYILEQIHSERLYHLVFENRWVKNFLDATPGLNALLEIGKIWSLVEDNPRYDLVIVDAPSTGHGLAMLKVPQIVEKAVKVGPLRTKAERINTLLKDPSKTALMIVTLPEEMPVNEAIEMRTVAKESIAIPLGPMVVNSLYPPLFSSDEWDEVDRKIGETGSDTVAAILRNYAKKVEYQQIYYKKLREAFSNKEQKIISLSHQFSEKFDLSVLQKLVKEFEGAFPL